MTALQDINDQIGKPMVAATVPDANTIMFERKDDLSHSKGGPRWIRNDGSVGQYARKLSPPHGMEINVVALVRKTMHQGEISRKQFDADFQARKAARGGGLG